MIQNHLPTEHLRDQSENPETEKDNRFTEERGKIMEGERPTLQLDDQKTEFTLNNENETPSGYSEDKLDLAKSESSGSFNEDDVEIRSVRKNNEAFEGCMPNDEEEDQISNESQKGNSGDEENIESEIDFCILEETEKIMEGETPVQLDDEKTELTLNNENETSSGYSEDKLDLAKSESSGSFNEDDVEIRSVRKNNEAFEGCMPNDEEEDEICNESQKGNLDDEENSDSEIDGHRPISEKILIERNLLINKTSNIDSYDFTKENISLDEENSEEMNILILGQTGVGKSTWINSIVNYLAYEDLEKAETGGVLHVIPASFIVTSVTDKGITKEVVRVGGEDSNEITDTGKSATQEPHTYTFYLGKKLVRLIDTPGLGDTEGISRDKEHLNDILNHISFLKDIHGICILLKPNETRISPLFGFCISELLRNLHKNAAKNIVFCFTNTRMTFYSPGDTTQILEQFLRELNLTDVITLSRRNVICLDNEVFRYLCTLKYDNVPKNKSEREEYKTSWIQSVTETKRLFVTIMALEPHCVADTTNLCSVRSKLFNLMEPIADISKTIQMNLAAIENQEKKINKSKLTIVEKFKKLNIKVIITKRAALEYSQTVCADKNCIVLTKLEASNITVTNYVQVCHEKCKLRNLVDKVGTDKRLRECNAFWLTGKCRKCGCSWKSHRHQAYVLKKEEVDVLDSIIEDEIVDETFAKTELELNKKEMDKLTKKYREEQDIILQTCLKFEIFLETNGLSQRSDSFKDYLKDLILEEKKKANATQGDDKLLSNLNQLLNRYEEVVEKMKTDMKAESVSPTADDIIELIEKLYNLKLTGKQIKNITEVTIKSNRMNQIHAEKPLPIGPVSFLEFNNVGELKNEKLEDIIF